MKKLIALFALMAGVSFAGTLSYTTTELDDSIRRSIEPLQLATYLHSTNDYTTASLDADTATKINIPTVAKSANGFAWDATNERFYLSESGITDKQFTVSASSSMYVGTGNNIITIELYKNGVYEEGISASRKVSTAGDVGSFSVVGSISLSTDDYLEIYATASLGGTVTLSRTAINFIEVN